jgi:hypothetical protein
MTETATRQGAPAPAEVREWARANEIAVSSTGTLPKTLVLAWNRAHPDRQIPGPGAAPVEEPPTAAEAVVSGAQQGVEQKVAHVLAGAVADIRELIEVPTDHTVSHVALLMLVSDEQGRLYPRTAFVNVDTEGPADALSIRSLVREVADLLHSH